MLPAVSGAEMAELLTYKSVKIESKSRFATYFAEVPLYQHRCHTGVSFFLMRKHLLSVSIEITAADASRPVHTC